MTVIADAFNGKPLNSPNDVVPHPDGSYWFTDPPYGGQLYEGHADAAGGPSNPAGRLRTGWASRAEFGAAKRELPTNCYRVDPSGKVDLVVTEEQVPDPNGLCFSPDYKKLYVVSTGKGPGDTGPGGKGEMYVFDVGADNKLSNRKLFSDFMIDGVKCGPDGVRTMSTATCGARAMPAGRSATAASPFGPRRASSSVAFACLRCAVTSASVAQSAIGYSWRRASRFTPSTSALKERRRPERPVSDAASVTAWPSRKVSRWPRPPWSPTRAP